MIRFIQDQLDELKDLIVNGQATRTIVVRKIRNIKQSITDYFSSQRFTVKDMKTRQELLELIGSLSKLLSDAERSILKMQFFDPDKTLDIIMKLEEGLMETILQIHVIGEARPVILDIKKEVEKKLKKEAISIPGNVEKYGPETVKLYQVLKVAPPKDYTIQELAQLTELSPEDVQKAVKNLEKEGYLQILYRGDEMVIRWTQ
jgi:hypothetical protein